MNSKLYNISLSGKTIGGRGWDDPYRRDEDDVVWDSIYRKIQNGKDVRKGKGYSTFFEVTEEELDEIIEDLESTAEVYSLEEHKDQEIMGWITAWKKDVAKLKQIRKS
jgi:hypothetical protein